MADYFNPASGLTDPSTFASQPGGGFWAGATQGMNQATMQPFRDNALSQQDLALKDAQMKFQEASSPAAVAGRQQAIAAKMATDTGTVQTQPSLTASQIAEHESHIRQLPAEEQAAIAKNAEISRQLKGKPQQELFDAAANMSVELAQVPGPMKEAYYQSKLQEFQQTHPDTKIPDSYKQLTPQLERQMQLAHMGQIHNVVTEQKLAEQELKNKGGLAEAQAHAGGTVAAARINESGAMAREKLRIDSDFRNSNPGQAQQADMKLLDSPARVESYAKANGFKSSEEAKTAIQGRIDARTQDMNQKTALELAKIRANNSIMPGSPDQGRTAGDLYREELGKLGGNKVGADPRSDAQAAIAKGAPRDAVAARYKQVTGKDL